MPQSLSHIVIHAVFSTKRRDPTICPPVRPALHAYLGGTLRSIDCPSLRVGGTDDHIHALFILSRTFRGRCPHRHTSHLFRHRSRRIGTRGLTPFQARDTDKSEELYACALVDGKDRCQQRVD